MPTARGTDETGESPPPTFFLKRGEFAREFWAVPLVAALSLSLALAVWHSGVKRYHSTGS